ncbi:UvrD-helicase domain-containing protein [Shimia thalassica]|uniref:UvrD-helicase domain-containing protein n=1 Tax=Shimia thalassica TaxID=1715693 RepID=UPI0027361CB1|nr:UvrD-helicase domain-containing protein [Shimia thalassica]MDP2518722.1 UvrD-helicase domain-containing protein [Shimia thalassica]
MVSQLDDLITRDDIADVAASEGLLLEDEDRISILEAMRSIDVQACPGSGKTTLVAAKLILLARKWPYKDRGICVLSHTNVAKDEIVERLVASRYPEAQRLLSHPHFIGTIQEFVGKYAAFPFIRSKGVEIRLVDTDTCVQMLYSKLNFRARAYVDRKSTYSNILYDFGLRVFDDNLIIEVPTFSNGSKSKSFKELHNTKAELIRNGFFFFRDVYTFAELALNRSETLQSALQARFPCVFLDEMQDTQKFQDDLLRKIFPIDDGRLIVQRFGDPDQAIFHGTGGEEPNESFNAKAARDMDFVVNKSHRFDGSIAGKTKVFSLNSVPLETEQSEDKVAELLAHASKVGEFQHTLLIYENETRERVIDCFAELVSSQFSNEKKGSDRFCVKAIGAVGNEIDPAKDQLKIGHYWPSYDKGRSKASFKPATLQEAVEFCRKSEVSDWADSYKLILDCVVRFLRLSRFTDENGRNHTSRSLRMYLKSKNQWARFRQVIHLLLKDAGQIEEDFWTEICEKLKQIFELNALPPEAEAFLAYSEEIELIEDIGDVEEQEVTASVQPAGNSYFHPDGFKIELSTIHGVKGETHDATLVLETKNHCCDLEVMMPYLTGCLPSEAHPNSKVPDKPHATRAFKPNKIFMRQLYVAMSRPRHLLCLAIHSDRVNADQEASLHNRGWNVQRVVVPAGAEECRQSRLSTQKQ